MEDTEKDFLLMTSEVAKACLWVAKETEAKEQEEHIAVHAAIKGQVSCYEWSEIQQL